MLFKVSPKVKGTLILKTVGRILRAGSKVSIDDEKVVNNDIRAAISKKTLIPIGKIKISKKEETPSSRVKVLNKTDKPLVIGEFSFRVNGGSILEKDIVDSSPYLQRAIADGIIEVIEDAQNRVSVPEKEEVEEKEEPKEEVEEEVEENIKDLLEKKKKDAKDGVVAKVWSPKKETMEEATKPPTTSETIMVDQEEEPVDVDMIDNKKIAKKKAKKKTTKRSKATKKRGTSKKKKKVKSIAPVGDVRKEATSQDVAIEMDSRGNPIEKPSDTLQHLIEDTLSGKEVDFVD